MIKVFDVVVLTIFILVQAHITGVLWRWSGERWRGTRLVLARLGVVGADLLLGFGYLLSFAWLFTWLRLPRRVDAYLEAFSLMYLLIATAAVVTVRIVKFGLSRWRPDETDPGRRRVLRLATQVAVAAPATVLGYGTFVTRLNFHVSEVDLPIVGLAPDLQGLRILQISDIHRGPFLSDAEFGQMIDASLGLRPHLTVVTGDLISAHGDPIDSCIAQLARLKADAGVFACMGNHERYAAVEPYAEEQCGRVGIRFLRGASQLLRFGNATLNLAGVDYQAKNNGTPYLYGCERFIEPGALNIMLSHNPDVFPVAARQGYNLLLAGHTHGGQVTIEILDESINPARFFTPYVYGVYRAGNAAAYVTRGIGTIGLPARIGAPPEISLLRLRKA